MASDDQRKEEGSLGNKWCEVSYRWKDDSRGWKYNPQFLQESKYPSPKSPPLSLPPEMAKKPQTPAAAAPDPVTEAKQRLRALAVSRKLLRRSAAPAAAAPLAPSPALLKLDGRDVVKRGQRKSRYLFSFPGLLAPLSAGRVGELADLASPNPLLYLEFPQGRMKLFGTHIYPKNKYLALQLTKSVKGVVCEDSFDSLIVFSDAWWIGLKEENPEELKLDFPREYVEGKSAECDFKGGAGGASDEAAGGNISGKEYNEATSGNISGKEYIEPLSPDSDDMLVESNLTNKEDTKNLLEATPVRQSARTAGKTLRYVDPDSGDDPIGDDAIASDPESSEGTDEKVDTKNGNAARRSIFGKTEDSTPATSSLVASEPAFTEADTLSTGKVEPDPSSPKKSKGSPQGAPVLVQATVSSLFEKAAKTTSKRGANSSPGIKGSAAKRQRLSSKKTNDQVQVKVSKRKAATPTKRKSGAGTLSSRKKSQVEDDEAVEISSDSQDDSDEDWTT